MNENYMSGLSDEDNLDDVSRSLEADADLLPYLPELLKDIYELGSDPDAIVGVIRTLDLPLETTRVLDLGCGKGAVSIAIAKNLGFWVDGVDLFLPFIEEARARSRDEGVAGRCVFRLGDAKKIATSNITYDGVVLTAVGDIFGDFKQTVRALRHVVRPGGFLLIADDFLPPGMEAPEGFEQYRPHEETLQQLTAAGDEMVREVVEPEEDGRDYNERNNRLIKARATELARRVPAMAERFFAYVDEQERLSRLYESMESAIWLLRKAGDSGQSS